MKIEFSDKIKKDFSLLTKGFMFLIGFVTMSIITGQIILLVETGHSSLKDIIPALIIGGVANIVLFFPFMLIVKYIKSNITINKVQ